MTVADLIAQLEDFDPDAEVRLAFQPSYPLECSAAEPVACEVKGRMVVYIAERSRLGYLSSEGREELGWSR